MVALDAQTGSLIITFIALLFAVVAVGWVLNIVAAVLAWQIGRPGRSRFILHIIGFFIYPLGAVMGFIWLFRWRKSDAGKSNRTSFPPPPPMA
jgi:uncharacterized BrkB/YihY/UPF0761 family membrane protein